MAHTSHSFTTVDPRSVEHASVAEEPSTVTTISDHVNEDPHEVKIPDSAADMENVPTPNRVTLTESLHNIGTSYKIGWIKEFFCRDYGDDRDMSKGMGNVNALKRKYSETGLATTSTDICEKKFVEQETEIEGHVEMMTKNLARFQAIGCHCDVKFMLKTTPVSAHRLILAAMSESFRAKFLPKSKSLKSVLDLTDLPPCPFTQCLLYFYTGKMIYSLGYAEEFYEIMTSLQLHEMKDQFVRAVVEEIEDDNSAAYARFKERYSEVNAARPKPDSDVLSPETSKCHEASPKPTSDVSSLETSKCHEASPGRDTKTE